LGSGDVVTTLTSNRGSRLSGDPDVPLELNA
jgi:hypothetical protein